MVVCEIMLGVGARGTYEKGKQSCDELELGVSWMMSFGLIRTCVFVFCQWSTCLLVDEVVGWGYVRDGGEYCQYYALLCMLQHL